jgi:hypothetical protein
MISVNLVTVMFKGQYAFTTEDAATEEEEVLPRLQT